MNSTRRTRLGLSLSCSASALGLSEPGSPMEIIARFGAALSFAKPSSDRKSTAFSIVCSQLRRMRPVSMVSGDFSKNETETLLFGSPPVSVSDMLSVDLKVLGSVLSLACTNATVVAPHPHVFCQAAPEGIDFKYSNPFSSVLQVLQGTFTGSSFFCMAID